MTAYTVSMEHIPPLLELWAKEYDVHVPVRDVDGFVNFSPWRPSAEIAWDYDVAYNSLKRFFLPPREDLLRFDLAASTAEPVMEAPLQLLFGVHPYDVKAINQLDQLMDQGTADVNYRKRREATVLVALTPEHVSDLAFWSSVGADSVDIGFDMYFTRISPSSFYVEVLSPKGEELLLARGELPRSTLPEREAAKRKKAAIRAKADKNGISFPWKQTPKLMSRHWDSPLWRNKARHCLSCGSCVMVCPTCYCFDVREEADLDLKGGRRFREWDGCMLPSFALVAGDHNFRPEARDRYRHRYFRKGKYIFDKIGELGCVGCGRCVNACTTGIANPMAVFNDLWEADNHES
ncbi:MAG: hypothetical protein D6E12_06590 [Desulfovibrio sp.]|nr:MAG: hypothetical protein D6E12_06590 [Desulfovibrio sp.]